MHALTPVRKRITQAVAAGTLAVLLSACGGGMAGMDHGQTEPTNGPASIPPGS